MNVTILCAAVSIICLASPIAARADAGSVAIAATTDAVSSTVSASVAGLSAIAIAAMPGYPVKAYHDGYRRGRVVVGYTIRADGTVGDVEVIEATPVQVFNRSAMKAVGGWRFLPSGASERRTVEFQYIAD